MPFPVSALVSGLLSAVLVWAASSWPRSKMLVALPLWTWAGPAVMTLDGPGGDIVCGGRGVMGFAALILLTGGLSPPALVLNRFPR